MIALLLALMLTACGDDRGGDDAGRRADAGPTLPDSGPCIATGAACTSPLRCCSLHCDFTEMGSFCQ